MNPEERQTALHELANRITKSGLKTPARMILDIVEPLGFIASQVALMLRPFTPQGRWRSYLTALDDEHGWSALHRIVDSNDS